MGFNAFLAINAAKPGKISIWRTIFAANEWSEIQVVRKTSVEFQLFATIFLLEVVGFEKFTCTTPSNSAAFTYNCNDENKRNAFSKPHSEVQTSYILVTVIIYSHKI